VEAKMTAPKPCLTVSFSLEKDWPIDYGFYMRAIHSSKCGLDKLKQLDLHRKVGECFLTFANEFAVDNFLSAGLEIEGHQVELRVGGQVSTSVHLLGCPMDLTDQAILHNLSMFGKILDKKVRRATVEFEGFTVETGKRFVNVILTKPLPSSLVIGDIKLRTWHRDQAQSCWRCKKAGHEAKECPSRPKTPWGKPQEQESTPRPQKANSPGTVDTLSHGPRDAAKDCTASAQAAMADDGDATKHSSETTPQRRALTMKQMLRKHVKEAEKIKLPTR